MPSPSHFRPVSEVHPVRTPPLLLPLIIGSLLLPAIGCKTSDRFGRGSLTKSGGSKDNVFTGVQPATAPAGSAAAGSSDPTSLASGGTTNRRSGLLAGRVLDGDARLRPNARIQIIDLDTPTPSIATLSASTNSEGYFDVTGLDPGKPYRLIARVKDGHRVLIGTARVVPPNPRIAIYLTDEVPAGETSGVPASTGVPAPASGDPAGPAATIGAPLRNPSEGVTTPLAGEPAPAINTTDPALIARDKEKKARDGFQRDPETVTVPGPGRDDMREKPRTQNPLPAPPSTASDPPAETSRATPDAPGGETAGLAVPVTPTRVPSCVRVGNRIDNIALYETDGTVFELKKQPRRKLVLLDFWFTGCGPCRQAIPHLNGLKKTYGRYGLEVISVACEAGPGLAQKQQSLAAGLKQLRVQPDYRILLSDRDRDDCPVNNTLRVYNYPTLILLDETGKIVWRAEGFDEATANKLTWAIYYKLTATTARR